MCVNVLRLAISWLFAGYSGYLAISKFKWPRNSHNHLAVCESFISCLAIWPFFYAFLIFIKNCAAATMSRPQTTIDQGK